MTSYGVVSTHVSDQRVACIRGGISTKIHREPRLDCVIYELYARLNWPVYLVFKGICAFRVAHGYDGALVYNSFKLPRCSECSALGHSEGKGYLGAGLCPLVLYEQTVRGRVARRLSNGRRMGRVWARVHQYTMSK